MPAITVACENWPPVVGRGWVIVHSLADALAGLLGHWVTLAKTRDENKIDKVIINNGMIIRIIFMKICSHIVMNITVYYSLQNACQQLADHSDTVQLDAEILLAHVLHCKRSSLRAHPDKPLTSEQFLLFNQLVEQRVTGLPIAYIMQHREFWSLKLHVTPATLIPRPETECLVGMVLATVPAAESLIVADLGTGSGAIAISLAKERPNWHILATDNNWAALEIAQYNALTLGLNNVTFFYGDWFQALPAHLKLDVVVSNPPYIAEQDPHLQQGDVRFEPRSALASGADGLKDLNLIIEQAHKHMQPGAWLFLEHGYNQGLAVQTLLQRSGYLNEAGLKDLSGQPRVAMGQVQLYE